MSSFLYKKIWHGISIHTRKCIPAIIVNIAIQLLAHQQITQLSSTGGADFKAIWLAHSSKPQTLDELQTLVAEGIEYFTNTFISAKRNDLTATEFRYGKAN